MTFYSKGLARGMEVIKQEIEARDYAISPEDIVFIIDERIKNIKENAYITEYPSIR